MSKKEQTGLSATLTAINKQFGTGTIAQLKERPEPGQLDVVSTGSIGLDNAIGVGGMPLGTVAEIFGGESSGKTTLCLQIVASAQALGYVCAFVDAEHALDLKYARNLGVNTGDLVLTQPDNGEQALGIVKQLVESGEVRVVVVDSVAALVPKAELDGEIGQSHMGLQARMMSQALRMITGTVCQKKALVIFINQTRQKIGIVYGSPITTTGGNALKFYCTLRLEVQRMGKIKGDGENSNPTGSRTRVKVVKNKVASPFRECEYDLIYGRGVCKATECFELGVALGVLAKSGAWFSYEGGRWQGKPRAVATLRADDALLAKLEAVVRVKLADAPPEVIAKSDSVIPDAPPERAASRVQFSTPEDLGAMAAAFITPMGPAEDEDEDEGAGPEPEPESSPTPDGRRRRVST